MHTAWSVGIGLKGGKRGVEEPVTDGVNDEPMPKGNGVGPRPYIL